MGVHRTDDAGQRADEHLMALTGIYRAIAALECLIQSEVAPLDVAASAQHDIALCIQEIRGQRFTESNGSWIDPY